MAPYLSLNFWALVMLSRKQCKDMNSITNEHFLAMLRLNRQIPEAVAYAPQNCRGVALPVFYTFQDKVQITYLLKPLGWGEIVANDTLVSLDAAQLQTSIALPKIESTGTRANFKGNSFLLRKRLVEIQASLLVRESLGRKTPI